MKVRHFFVCLLIDSSLALLVFPLSVCARQPGHDIAIIPKPAEIHLKRGAFIFNDSTTIVVDSDQERSFEVAHYLAGKLTAMGAQLEVVPKGRFVGESSFLLLSSRDTDASLGKEGYTLDCEPQRILIRGEPAGLFYGIQSLLQLLPPQIYDLDNDRDDLVWSVPALVIYDKPRFQWRGMHLDVGRHMFPVEYIKKYIDRLALHKMNSFHWHLTDDQGWRIEINKFPRLTEIGAWRDGTTIGHLGKPHVQDGIRYGGFYTQDEIRDIVQYAKERFISIVPEIELPGHSIAALTSYPNLSCTGGPFEVRKVWGISDDIYCAGNDQVFEFLQDVFTEVLDLFPSEFIHVGGDEAPKIRWQNCEQCQTRIRTEGLEHEDELQSYFIRRIETFLNSKGRKLIGWDEILEGGLAPNATVMSWRGVEGGIKAAGMGHDVVMSPGTHCYFDHYQGDSSTEPLAIGGFTPLEKVYAYEPIPADLTPEQAKHILGAQGNVWTEYIKTPSMVDYMALPRMCALAEVVWSPKDQRDLDDFLNRMSRHYSRMDEMGIEYRWPSLKGMPARTVFIEKTRVDIRSARPDCIMHYTLDGTEPCLESPLLDAPFWLTESTVVKAREFLPNGRSGQVYRTDYVKQTPKAPFQGSVADHLQFQYFEFKEPIDVTSNLKQYVPVKSGLVARIEYPFQELPEMFGLVFAGLVTVPETGVYTFTLRSNDGSAMYVHDQFVVDNDGWHGAVERYGQIALQKGKHPIRIDYFQAGAAKALDAFIQGPGMDKQQISAGMLSHSLE